MKISKVLQLQHIGIPRNFTQIEGCIKIQNMLSSAYMQMIENAKIVAELKEALPQTMLRTQLETKMKLLQTRYSLSDSKRNNVVRSLFTSLEHVDLSWNKRSLFQLYTFKSLPVGDEDILEALTNQKNTYLSHNSALYFNALTDQRPKDHFVTTEKNKIRTNTPIDQYKIRQAFIKPPRKTQNYFSYQKTNFYLLEKPYLDEIGVVTKQFGSPGRELVIKLTNLERTLIDCVIAPHYSGGVQNIVKCFEDASLDFDKLIEIYLKINPLYPYWQAVGFFLDQIQGQKLAIKWAQFFEERKKIPFFVSHMASSDWKLSQKWQVYYPGESFEPDN